jgi:hypothetical protein
MPETNYRALCFELLQFGDQAGEIAANEGLWPDCDPGPDWLLDRARAALAQPAPEILPKNCWLDDEPDIWPSPCVFEDPEEAISNCAHASVLHSEGKCKTDCQHYRQPTSGTH